MNDSKKIITDIESSIDSALSAGQRMLDSLAESEDKNPYNEKASIDFLEASKPLIKYLAENHHPHTIASVTANGVELLEGCMSHQNINEYLVD